MMKMRTIPEDYELSEQGKQIICNAIQRIKKSLDTFQFAIQDRVTPITAGELNRVNYNLNTIRELLDNERSIAQFHYSYCIENESGNDET